MKSSFRIAALSLSILAASAPAAVFAGPTPKPPQKAPAHPEAKQPVSDGQAVLMLALLGGAGVIAGGIFVAKRMRPGGKGDGRPPEPILAERKHDWELRLTPEQESAMLQGVQAYRDGGHSLYLSHGDALITFYEPRMLVSLHRLTDAFLAAGAAAVTDPIAVVRGILDGFVASEPAGVLHLQKGWFGAPVDGLDHLKFTNLCYDALTRPQPYIEGSQGSSSDENSGALTLNVQIGGPMNTFCADLRRVLPVVQQGRQAQPSAPLIDLVRRALQAMCKGELPGGMWTRGAATDAEKELVVRMVATSAARAG